jgi:DNA-binding NtrC family response regulator
MSRPRLSLLSFASPDLVRQVRNSLEALGYRVHSPRRPRLSGKQLQEIGMAMILLERMHPRVRGLEETLDQLTAVPRFAVLAESHTDWDNTVLERFCDFVSWPCHTGELGLRLRRLCLRTLTESDCNWVADDLLELNLIGRSPAFLRTLDRLRRFTACSAAVMVEGETGTGKELAARAIHYLGERRDRPFIPVNCGALPDSLIENELFGHERGAYTDAKLNHKGLIEQAEGGTLFLDEIESLSAKGQVLLLRFLQDQEYRPLGAQSVRRADVRVISATNRPLQQLVAEGGFREDLLYRLNVMPVQVPPLRERPEDLDPLCEHFMRTYRVRYSQPMKALHPDSRAWLRDHHWPGNIRELENLLHREFLLAEGDHLRFSFLPGGAGLPQTANDGKAELVGQPFGEAKASAVSRFERHYLHQLMKAAQGNLSLAARRAGKERRSLGRLLKKHGIQRTDYA